MDDRFWHRRIALLGGESSGKSTLAEALARETQAIWVHEYGRELWQVREAHLGFEELLDIAHVQIEREDRACAQTDGWVFCDTTPLTTLFYSLDLFGRADPLLETLALRPYAHHFICAPDFAFVQDGWRRDAAFSLAQTRWYQQRLDEQGVAWRAITGPLPGRTAEIVNRIGRRPLPPPGAD